jgi:hypothetical protein
VKKECEQLKAGRADKADKAEEVAERQAEKTQKPRLRYLKSDAKALYRQVQGFTEKDYQDRSRGVVLAMM